MTALNDDPLVQAMNKYGIPITRENYIEMAYDEPPFPWLPEHEAGLPRELQNWALFSEPPPAPAPAA